MGPWPAPRKPSSRQTSSSSTTTIDLRPGDSARDAGALACLAHCAPRRTPSSALRRSHRGLCPTWRCPRPRLQLLHLPVEVPHVPLRDAPGAHAHPLYWTRERWLRCLQLSTSRLAPMPRPVHLRRPPPSFLPPDCRGATGTSARRAWRHAFPLLATSAQAAQPSAALPTAAPARTLASSATPFRSLHVHLRKRPRWLPRARRRGPAAPRQPPQRARACGARALRQAPSHILRHGCQTLTSARRRRARTLALRASRADDATAAWLRTTPQTKWRGRPILNAWRLELAPPFPPRTHAHAHTHTHTHTHTPKNKQSTHSKGPCYAPTKTINRHIQKALVMSPRKIP